MALHFLMQIFFVIVKFQDLFSKRVGEDVNQEGSPGLFPFIPSICEVLSSIFLHPLDNP